MDLFDRSTKNYEPLASRMRPRTLEEYVGQDHILGPGRLLRRSIEADRLTSVLLSGPPGTGKTTLARVIAQATRGSFLALNAVLSGIKEIREVIEKAQETRRIQGRKTILFVDEVHRWNKSQQDALLPWVENGTFILIGATTENPFFEVNSALVSRSRVFQLVPLTSLNLKKIAEQAIQDPDRGYGRFQVMWEDGALEHLIEVSAGDARSLLNAMELAIETSVSPFPPEELTKLTISLDSAEQSIQRKAVLYDKDGDYHFDTISAFIKSIRGSDPDAALYWMARMVRAGEDPDYIFRRLLVSASEDVGLADPRALSVVVSAAEAFRRVGLPEGQYFLSQAALYLATAPKSNSTMAFFEALKKLETEEVHEVPSHLKDANRDGKAFGHGQNYLYPHAFKDNWVSQQYLPGGMTGQVFYHPSVQGYEGTIRQSVLERRESVLSTHGITQETEILTWTDERNTPWLRRLASSDAAMLEGLRKAIFNFAHVSRHHIVWVASDLNSLLLVESLRAAPEGRVWLSSPPGSTFETTQEYLAQIPENERPLMTDRGWGVLPDEVKDDQIHPDRIFVWGPALPPEWNPSENRVETIVVSPDHLSSTRLTALLSEDTLGSERSKQLRALEESFLIERQKRQWSQRHFESWIVHEHEGTRQISRSEWLGWWTPGQKGSWPQYLVDTDASWAGDLERLRTVFPGTEVTWKRCWLIGKRHKEIT